MRTHRSSSVSTLKSNRQIHHQVFTNRDPFLDNVILSVVREETTYAGSTSGVLRSDTFLLEVFFTYWPSKPSESILAKIYCTLKQLYMDLANTIDKRHRATFTVALVNVILDVPLCGTSEFYTFSPTEMVRSLQMIALDIRRFETIRGTPIFLRIDFSACADGLNTQQIC